MGSMSFVHWMIVVGVVVLLFGRGKISGLMGDIAEGMKSFKRGMAEESGAQEQVTSSGDLIAAAQSGTVDSAGQFDCLRTMGQIASTDEGRHIQS